MKKKKIIKWLLLVFFIAITNIMLLFHLPVNIPDDIPVYLTVEADKNVSFQFFYSYGIYDVEHCQTIDYINPGEKITLVFSIPSEFTDWRLDFGYENSTIKVYAIEFGNGKKINITSELFNESNEIKDIDSIAQYNEFVEILAVEEDPQCIFGFSDSFIYDKLYNLEEKKNTTYNIIFCVIIDCIAILSCLFSHKIMEFYRDIKNNRKLMLKLAKNDFKTKYVGSYLGIIWAFIQPVVTVLVYWFVFSMGLKSGSVGEMPFVLWLIAGLVPWFFFSDALASGTTTMMEYQYLVKKVVFKIDILPMVKILSAMFVHLFFMLITVVIYSCYGYFPDFYTLQILYYSLCGFALSLAVVYLTSSIVVFFRDVTQFVTIFLQVGVWMTPIMWQVSIIPERFLWIFKSMPMYYVVSGYRDAMINKVWFWEKPYDSLYFWCVTFAILALGVSVFKKLKVHFADVL